jgi:HSP20 family protein
MSTPVKFTNPFPVMNSFFDDFFSKDWFDWNNKNFTELGNTLPAVNVKDSEKSFEIELAAPGMKKDDFKIELRNNVLHISSEKKEEKEEKDKNGNFVRREFNYQSFSRSMTLPDSIDDGKIEAKYNDGILRISVPKTAAVKPSAKKIAIK